MSWNVNWSDVNTQLETVPAQEFVFSILGASYDERDPSKVVLSVAIDSDGPFKGRKMYPSYPDPSRFQWSPKMLKRLSEAVGVEMVGDEDPVSYLNRVKGSKFASNVLHRKYTPEGGNEVTKAELNIFNTRPAV